MTQETNSKQMQTICKHLRQIANTLEGNKNAEIQAFFIKVVRTFADDNVLFFNENAFGNDFVEWQIIERKESVFDVYENSRICVEKSFLYLQKTALDSSTQPVEIAKIPTNFSFSDMYGNNSNFEVNSNGLDLDNVYKKAVDWAANRISVEIEQREYYRNLHKHN